MMFGYGSGWPFWEVALMWVGMIAFWGVLIWAVYALITSARKTDSGPRSQDPRQILEQRLARGDIDPEEYQRLRDLITPGDQAPAGAGGRR